MRRSAGARLPCFAPVHVCCRGAFPERALPMKEPLERYLAERRAAVDDVLQRLVSASVEWPEHLHRAMRYSLFPGGGRLYAILAIGGYEAVAAVPDLTAVLPIAAAIEMLNVSIQVHDDLPALHDTDSRDALPTNHRVHGEALAILTGDALRLLAFQVLTDRAQYPAGTSPGVLLEVARTIAAAAGEEGVVGSQSVSLGYEGEIKAAEHLAFLFAKRTGGLMRASILAGALAAGVTDEQRRALSTFGDRLGLAYSLAEDLAVDSASGEEPNRARSQPSVVELIGARATREWIERAVGEAVAAIQSFDERCEALRAIARRVSAREV